MDYLQDPATTQTPLQVLETLSKLANEGSTAIAPTPPYETFLGMENSPINILFFQATGIFFLLQFVLLYTTWAIFPIFGKERRRLGWTLSFFCSIGFMIPSLLQFGYVRLTIYERLGLDAISLGLVDPENATVFTVWAPRFLRWVQQLPAYAFSSTEVSSSLSLSLALKTLSNAEGVLRLGGTALQWMVSLPIFSLAPLKPTQLFNPQALSPYLGGGRRLLYSLENFPQESVFGAVAVAYFVGYALADLILGFIHYPDQVDPLSGWAHHIVYTLLAWRLAKANHLWIFSICGGPLEMSTLFLSVSNMFPHLESSRSFWFPFTFILTRIIGHALILQEILFNYSTPSGAAELFAGALGLHAFWIWKYFEGVRRRARRTKKAATSELKQKQGQAKEKLAVGTSTSSSIGSEGKTIQLRIHNSKK
ncbi:hypothetical protein K457DRAFT_12729 [Linnemannia elongata AG-77]|uniref:TLC domain-containing protein n=1 Tax=Linnemannia elongata AG-77 TaxID=1314771 RepID=A0A197KES7_9FUNG|nr:hypothetical protein K457DRAFT_12729 [Linnemannia elongata AG-77]